MIERKIQQRMKNLLAMSKDKGSPNEATIAKRRLDTMCAEHGLTVASVELGDFRATTTTGRTKNYKSTSRVETVGFPHGFRKPIIIDHGDAPAWDATVVEMYQSRAFTDIDLPIDTEGLMREILKDVMSTMSDDMIRDLLKK